MSKKAIVAVAAFVLTLIVCETFIASPEAKQPEPNGFRAVFERQSQIDAAIAAGEGVR